MHHAEGVHRNGPAERLNCHSRGGRGARPAEPYAGRLVAAGRAERRAAAVLKSRRREAETAVQMPGDVHAVPHGRFDTQRERRLRF